MEDELHHPLRPLRERLGRVEAVEAREVDEGEDDEERECDDGCARQAVVVSYEPVPREEHEKDRREDVRERQRAGELPLQLVERDREDGQQEEPVECGLQRDALARCDGSASAVSSSRASVSAHSRTRARVSGRGRPSAPRSAPRERSRGWDRLEHDLPSPTAVRLRLDSEEPHRHDSITELRRRARIVEPAVDDVDGLARQPARGCTRPGRKPGYAARKSRPRVRRPVERRRSRPPTNASASPPVTLPRRRRPPGCLRGAAGSQRRTAAPRRPCTARSDSLRAPG